MTQLFEHGYALIIGVNESKVPEWALPDVHKDVAAVEQVLINPDRCGYRPENVHVIKGAEATRQGILGGLSWLQTQLKANTAANATAVVFYSGHGWQDTRVNPPTYYFIPYDVEQERLRGTALRADDFAEAVDAIRAQRLLVLLDCCHAGGMGVKELDLLPEHFTPASPPAAVLVGGGVTAKDIQAQGSAILQQGAGRAVLVSCMRDQKSYIRSDRVMSIFTYHLIEGLTGHAQPVGGSPEVLVSDLVSYVHRKVPASASEQYSKEQQPDTQLTGNFAVALVLGGKGITKGEVAPDPIADAKQASTSGTAPYGISIGKIEAVNVGKNQVIDQRNANINVGGHTDVNTGGGGYVGGDVNTHGGDFVGRDKTVDGDMVYGDKVGGDKVKGDKISVGNVSGTGIAIGRNASANVTTGVDAVAIGAALEPVAEAIRQSSLNPAAQAQALQMVGELKQELSKGKSDDGHVAKVLKGLTDLVPGAVSAVVSAFATPVLAGLAGPTTKFLLESVLGHK